MNMLTTPDGRVLHHCDNPVCNRWTSAFYCCHMCGVAREGKYEIHEDGLLGHSECCNDRFAERGATR